jgi:hypothetical protein
VLTLRQSVEQAKVKPLLSEERFTVSDVELAGEGRGGDQSLRRLFDDQFIDGQFANCKFVDSTPPNYEAPYSECSNCECADGRGSQCYCRKRKLSARRSLRFS